jgi:hypothetical protein
MASRVVRSLSTARLLSIFAALAAAQPLPARAAELNFTQLSTPFSNFISVDYFEPTNGVVAASYYPTGIPHNFRRIAADGTQSQHTSVAGLSDEVKVATARSPEMGGFAGSPFPAGTMFAGRGTTGVISKIDPLGDVLTNWSTMPNGASAGRFWGLHVDRTGVFGGDLIGATYSGHVYRINGAGVATQLGSTGVALQGLMTVPNEPLVYGGLAGKILIGAESQNRLYWFDAGGNSGYWSVPVAIDDLDLIAPNENFIGLNYGGGRLLGASAAQFQSQGLVGNILATQEFASLHALTWDFDANAPRFEQITTAAGSPVSNHWQDVAFAPAGISELKTTLPTADEYRISGAFGVVDGLHAVPIPSPQTAVSRYAYQFPNQTGNPPEARADKGVMSVVEDSIGNHSLLIVLDQSGDATGGSLRLQLTGIGAALTSTYVSARDDVTGDTFSYSNGTGLFDWSWPAGQTDGAVIVLPFPRLAGDPLAPWSITFSTLNYSGLDGFVFLADDQEIELGNTGFNFTLGIPLPGDFNSDNLVDAADYVVWRKNPGGNYTLDDFNTWRANFGNTLGGGATIRPSGGDVPESASIILACWALYGTANLKPRHWRKAAHTNVCPGSAPGFTAASRQICRRRPVGGIMAQWRLLSPP